MNQREMLYVLALSELGAEINITNEAIVARIGDEQNTQVRARLRDMNLSEIAGSAEAVTGNLRAAAA